MAKYVSKNREKLLWELISKVRSNISSDKIKKMAVRGLSQIFDPDRCMILEYDENAHTLPIEKSAEYLKSKDLKSMVGVNLDQEYEFWNMTNALIERYKKQRKNVIYIPDAAEYIQGSHLMGSKIENYCIHSSFKTCVGISIFEKNKIKMFFTVKFRKKKQLSNDDVEFIKIYAEQVYIALKQNQIINKFKHNSDKEKMLKKVINTIRSTLDTQMIIKTFVVEVGKYLKSSRAFFAKYDEETDAFLTPDEGSEYLASPEKESYRNLGRDFSVGYEFVSKRMKTAKKILVTHDSEKFIRNFNLEGTEDCINIRKYKVGTSLLVPVLYKKMFFGVYVFEREEPNTYTQEDIDFVVSVSAQTVIALYHAAVLKKAKMQAKNEALLRKIITKAAKTLDMNNMKKIVRDIGKATKADRCYFLEFDPDSMKAEPVNAQNEYLSSTDIKSVVGYDFPLLRYFNEISSTEKEIRIFDFEKIKAENLPQMEKIISHSNNFNVKTGIGIPLFYMDKFFMILIIEYVKEEVVLSDTYLEFLKFIAKQLEIAFNQIKLYQETRQIAEREMLLKNVVSEMASTLDKRQIGKYITRLIGTRFNLDRCFIVEYDTDNDSIIAIDEDSEYRASDDVKSLVGYEFPQDDDKFFKNVIEIFDTKSFMEGMKDYDMNHILEYLEEYSIKEGFQVKLAYGGIFWGELVGHSSDENKKFSEEERELIRTLAKHVGIALYQSKLYLKEKQTAEREKLLRDIITATRKTLDIKLVKKTIVNEILKTLKADRVSVFEYDALSGRFSIIDESSEALSSYDVKGFKGLDMNVGPYKYFADIYRSKREIIYSDRDEFIKERNLQGTKQAETLENVEAMSTLSIPILYRDELLGILVITYRQKYIVKKEHIDFVKSLSEQIAIALYQSRLFEKEKKARQKEKLLNRIVTAVRRSIDLNEMKQNIVTYIGKYFEADEVLIHQIKSKTKEFDIIDEFSEYISSDDILLGVNKYELNFFKNMFSLGKEFLINDFEEYIENFENIDEDLKNNIKNLNIKSSYIFPIKYQNNQIATLFIVYDKKRVELSKEELDDIRYLVIHISLALNQAITYQNLQQKIDQELLFRKIVEAIRSSLDLKEIKLKIVEEIGKAFNADRCYLRAYDIESNMFLAPEVEYLSSSEIKSLKNVEPDQEGLRYFFDQVKHKDGIYPVEVTEDFIIEHNAQNQALDRYFKQTEIKSDFAIPVWSKKGELVFLVLHYINESFYLTESVKQFLIMVSKHISIALEQSDLYNEVKKQAEREKTGRKIVEIIRSSFDIDQILLDISEELLTLFNVQRIYASRINFAAREIFVEITSRENINKLSAGELQAFNSVAKFWDNYLKVIKEPKIIENMELSDLPSEIKQVYVDMGIKSFILLPIKSQDEIWGSISLSSVDYYKKWTKDDISFLEGIVSQLDVAIRQAELYSNQERAAKKESILRNIISEIKLTRDLKQAYKKLLKILLEIFDLDRVLFLEYSIALPNELNIKYEYTKDKKDLSLKNTIFPELCSEKFNNFLNNFKPLVINDIEKCSCERNVEFFEKNKINSILGMPLVKYNDQKTVLGFLILCCNEARVWTQEETELMNSISEAVISVIWEITKFIEIEDLRNSFVLTLAHDFQVPLIGEKLSIEFLLESCGKDNEQNKNLLKEIMENNNNIISLLNKSVDIYNYDAGKKSLFIELNEVYEILDNAIYVAQNTYKNPAEIDLLKSPKELFIKIDRQEIMKVLGTLLENALEHTPVGDIVKIRYYANNKRVIIGVHNNGEEIPKETQDIIFKRYEMALAIERKIGAGTGLFLAKKIIEAHGGNIWFETGSQTGTTFFISLPQVESIED